MVCGLEIVVAVLGCITAIATLGGAVSEALPFIKKISGNGMIHTIYHLFNKEKCDNIGEVVKSGKSAK
tara:strand:- start:582 stop:785 length:204 start_codon:yes stop_codon:yes gene_type:complete